VNEFNPNEMSNRETLALVVAIVGWLDQVTEERDVAGEIAATAQAILATWDATDAAVHDPIPLPDITNFDVVGG